MSLKAAFMLPHPPLIVSEIGKGREEDIIKTKTSYEKVTEEIENINPDTIIISSPHTKTYSDGFYISKGDSLTGTFENFGAKQVSFKEEIDNELVEEIEKCNDENYKILYETRDDIELDHGTMVPLYFIRKRNIKAKIIVVGLSGLPLIEHYRFGMLLQKTINNSNKRVVYIASGDLSHKLQTYGPYGYAKEGPEYDKQIMEVCGKAKFLELLKFKPEFLEKAAECGHRSFTIMAGTFDKLNVDSKEYSHEDITGVGYGICSFYPQGENKKRNFYEQYLIQEEKRVISKDELVNLARKTIENYITKNITITVPEDASDEITKNKAGVFVSLHKFCELRGCIGTFLPTKSSIAEEIIRNAIAAATEDYRFDRVTEEELKYLEINVDVLNEPVKINSIDELDAKKYGVIVYSGFKRGLLLPDIEGVDTVEQQINIARRKGNIEPDEEITIEKFEVVRHR